MKTIKETELLSNMRELAQSYVPEWKFSTENPDPGSVVAMLCCDMLEENKKRFDKVIHKHKVQYMNLFDKLKEEPIESARTYIKFSPVAGYEGAVDVPKGTEVFCDDDETGRRIIFETMHRITAADSELRAVFVTDKDKDRIVQLMKMDQSAKDARFSAFDITSDSKSQHVFFLCYEDAFSHLKDFEVTLKIKALDDSDAENAAEKLCSDKIDITYLTPDGEERFDKVECVKNTIKLTKHDSDMQKILFEGRERYVIAFRAKELTDVEINGVELYYSDNDLRADEVYCGGILQNTEHFKPFGSPMEIFAECGIECKELFARKGTEAKLSFDLSFEIMQHLLPEFEQETNYKIVMRQPKTPPKPKMQDIKADYAVIEYYGEKGWKRLINEENASYLFNGSIEGGATINFRVPDDIIDAEDYTGLYRMRIRLLRADNLYTVPSTQYVPVIDNLRFSYTYESNPIYSDFACTENNFDKTEVTYNLKNQRLTELFKNTENDRTSMYLGFDHPFWGTPSSLYFEIENNEDHPIDFKVQYYSPDGFCDIKTIDNTMGFLYSGTMLMIIPKDMAKAKLFDHDLYWLRLVRNDGNDDAYLPLIKGVYTNMAQAENRRTQEEVFYIDDIDAPVRIELSEKEIIHADVFVNEASESDEDNWVKWEKGAFYTRQGRIYEIDLNEGTIAFEKDIFSVFPIKEDGPHIKVCYQSYQGKDANVKAGALHTMTSSIRYISRAENPIAAYGGYDGYNEETSAAIISNMLRTRGRAISEKDYFDLISQVSYGVKRIKCCNGIDQYGKEQDDAITIAVLIEDYEKGSHIFSSIKEQIREKLIAGSSVVPLGKTLILSQPYFVRLSVRMWVECEKMEGAYDLQKDVEETISEFIDPLTGGFAHEGWEIGTLPTMQQILAYLKIKKPEAAVSKVVMTANFGRNEHAVNDEIMKAINNPFAMAVNGEHTVYVELK